MSFFLATITQQLKPIENILKANELQTNEYKGII